ncbi:MAG: toll/interleukin-1 receptor domain-containing protein [Bacteroidota bacterium]
MKLISELSIPNEQGGAVIQLLQGDLSMLPVEHATDILVLSAFPGEYLPTPGTLIHSLEAKGLSIEQLAANKQSDLREQLHCWLSHPLEKEMQQKLHIKRILCFEPGHQIHASQEIVGNIFRCINTFAFDEKNNVVAIPMVASGCQRARAKDMLPALLEASIFWLENGLPLRCIKLVIYREEKLAMAREIFNTIRNEYLDEQLTRTGMNIQPQRVPQDWASAGPQSFEAAEGGSDSFEGPTSAGAAPGEEPEEVRAGSTIPAAPPAMAPAPTVTPVREVVPPAVSPAADGFDYFISYAHTHSDLVHAFVQQVKAQNSGLQIFYDRESIPPGGMWIRQLSAAIQKAKKVLVFLSPDYDKSPVCWDEFQCAKLMEYNKRKQIIQTIYLYDYKEIEMPPIMGIYSYIDCREGDPDKLKASVEKILSTMA